jgi:hypothetical protein
LGLKGRKEVTRRVDKTSILRICPDISRMIKSGGRDGWDMGKRPFWRPTCRWEDNIRIDFNSIGCESVDRI